MIVLGILVLLLAGYLVYDTYIRRNCEKRERTATGGREMLQIILTGNFLDTGHSNGKIYVSHRHKQKTFCG